MTRAELVAWGEAFGRAATAPLVIALAGDLGAGKTTLAQAICAGYGVTEPVTSPTFALVHRYDAPRSPVYHLDLYRYERPSELVNLGWDEIALSHALVIVEWPERAGDLIPAGHVPIDLEYAPSDPDRRVLLAGNMITLGLEASTYAGSVAVVRDGLLLPARDRDARRA
jgi:tRNA threonylcarbamoyladenosine biosynthesis protein TsaE